MKLKYLSGILLLAAAFGVASCDDEDDYTIHTQGIITEITTGAANVTAVSAEIQGTVKDLSQSASTSYDVGVYYGTEEDPTTTGTKKSGRIDESGNVITSINGLITGQTYYYATYVTLQNKVTKFGEVKSFVATQAKVVTNDAADITCCKATFSAAISGTEGLDAPQQGVKIALTEAGIATGKDAALTTVEGLLPGHTYYYAAYVKVGDGYVFGETKALTTQVQNMEYVDLGLSVMWAKCNIGAETESESGALFGYGDPTAMLTTTNMEAYPNGDIVATENDIAGQLTLDGDSPMSSAMPTAAQMAELINKTTQEWTTVDGVNGVRFTAANGNSIFLPATGYREDGITVADGKGYYWSGNVGTVNKEYANTLVLDNSASKAGFSRRVLGLSVRSVRPYAEMVPETGKVVFGDIENNGRMRIEIYNEYGTTGSNPPIAASSIKFKKNMVVTFTLSGITDNLKDGAKGSYIAGLEYSDPTWGVGYWSSLTEKGIYEAEVTGDGQYSVWCEVASQANGAVVFCVDIAGLWADIADPSKVAVGVNSIKLDADVEQILNQSIVEFNNKDGNNTDGRIEIYNEYGNSGAAAPQYYNSSLKFSGMMLVDYTISGIDGNLVDGATANYKSELSFADADWYPSYWGGADYGAATVTGDGTYQVYTYLGNCEGAVVWTIELYGLWKDLVDPSKVKVNINKVVTPGKN